MRELVASREANASKKFHCVTSKIKMFKCTTISNLVVMEFRNYIKNVNKCLILSEANFLFKVLIALIYHKILVHIRDYYLRLFSE